MPPRSTRLVVALLGLAASTPCLAAGRPLEGVRRVVFLGDSITHSGEYVADLEAFLRLRDRTLAAEFLDLGLPSETVSGLSEPGHAGGQFPRPDLAERLDRVLAATRPDLVVACYGMNDGVYSPYSEGRAAAFRSGVEHLRARAAASGAMVLHLTPPVFDAEPIRANTLPAGLAEYRRPFRGYDEVLARYSEWLLSKRADGWDVADVHGPMRAFLDDRRKADPGFRLANDGVHLDATGHWLIARAVLLRWGVPEGEVPPDAAGAFARWPEGADVRALVGRKQGILKAAWLTDTGHTRPGMAKGLPLDEARRRAGEVEAEVRSRLGARP